MSLSRESPLDFHPASFEALMEAIRAVDRVMFSSERYAKVFSMDQQTFALPAHVSHRRKA